MTLHVLFGLFQAGSLLAMVLFIHEYRRISAQHGTFIQNIESGHAPSSKRQSKWITWTYIATTFAWFGVTSTLYFSLNPF